MKHLIFPLVWICLSIPLFGQHGLVRGTLYDGETGETIPYGTVFLENDPGTGTSTDLDGAFELRLQPGTYNISFSYIGYSTTTVENVTVNEGNIQIINPKISTAHQTLTEIVVTSTQLSNTQSALLTIKRKSPNVIDGVSRELFSKAGDGDAGSAIKRVTGVSIVDGKHVLVRGLGDRYSKTILNGTEIPGLDPDKNSVQFDLFPTHIIENILISKSFMPNLPGDFSGGLVNIQTREFPESPQFRISASVGYNPAMNMRDDFLTYDGSKTDFLGFDNGLRELPFDKNTKIPDPVHRDPALRSITSSFQPEMSAYESTSNLDQSYSIVYGNQFNVGQGKLGLIATANYKSSYQTFPELEYNTFLKFPNNDNYNLFRNRSVTGQRSEQDIILTNMAGVNYKLTRSKFGVNWFRIQNGTSSSAKLMQINSETNPSTIERTNLEYRERSMDHLRLTGTHNPGDGKMELDWTLSRTSSTMNEPDNRVTAFEIVPRGEVTSYELNPSVGAGVTRMWRNLDEINYSGMLNLSYGIPLKNNKTTYLRVGGAYTYKDRDFGIQNYLFRVEQASKIGINGDPNQLFLAENIWDPNSRIGTYARGNFEPANSYQANQQIAAGYAMNELPLGDRWKTIYGVRLEQVVNRYTGQNNLGDRSFDNQVVLDQIDVLPSLNVLFTPTDKINIRASGNRTLARPTFKEKSLAQIQDLISGKTFIGNIDLDATEINNFDLRIENYFDLGELISVSVFYKQLFDPIELVAYSDASPDNIQPRNSQEASIRGVELEWNKKLNFLGRLFSETSLGGNLSFIDSKVNMGETEYQSRLHNARNGEEVLSTRSLVDQAPILANVFFQYAALENKLNINLSYNYQGKQLSIVGIGRNSDIYTLPTHNLNFNTQVKLGASNRVNLTLHVENLLDQDAVMVYQSFQSPDRISERYRPGRSISLGVSIDL